MLVGSSTSAFYYSKNKEETLGADISFATNDEKEHQPEIKEYKSHDEINADDTALEQFKKDLTQKGAFKFMHDFNMQKIEEMLEEYKKKLEKELEENPDSKMDIDQMVNEYKKQLLERFRELEDDKDDSKTLMSSSRIAFEIADNLKPKLEDFLKGF